MLKKITLLSFLVLGVTLSSTAMAENHRTQVDSVKRVRKLKTLTIVSSFKKSKMTLSKMSVPMSDLPITANEISLEPLKQRGVYTMVQATRFVPGVNTRLTYGAFNRISIRGFDNSPVDVDGMRDERTTFNSYPLPDLSSVQSIEVIKGPASVLTGHSAVGGVVNIIRKSASFTPSLNFDLLSSTLNTYQVTLGGGGALSKKICTFINANIAGGKGWRNTNDKKFSLYSDTRFLISSRQSLDLRLAYINDFYGTEIGLPATMPNDIYDASGKLLYHKGDMLKGLNRKWRYNNQSDFMYNKNFNASLKYKWNIAKGWKLTEYAMFTYDIIDYFGTEALSYPQGDEGMYPTTFTNSAGMKKSIDLTHVQLTFPLRFQHRAKTYQNQLFLNGQYELFDIQNDFVAGTSFAYMDRVSFSGYNDAGSTNITANDKDEKGHYYDVYGPGVQSIENVMNPQSAGPMYSRFSKAYPTGTLTYSFYLQNYMKFNDYFKGFVAGRLDNYTLTNYNRMGVIDMKADYDKSAVKKSSQITYHAFTYRAGLVCQPTDDLTFYTSVASFFLPIRRTYSPQNVYINSLGHEIQPKDFDKAIFKPMSGYQIEFGSSIEFNDMLSGSLSIYRIQQNNVVKTVGTMQKNIEGKDKTVNVIAQLGTVVSKGIEAELTFNPIHNLFLTAGYAYQDVRIAKMAKNDKGFKDAEEGQPLNNVPNNNFYTYGNYMFDSGLLKGLSLDYSLTHVGKVYRSYSDNLYYKPNTVVGAGVHYTIAKTGVTLGVECRNLLNSVIYARSLGNQMVPEVPRNFLFVLNYKL